MTTSDRANPGPLSLGPLSLPLQYEIHTGIEVQHRGTEQPSAGPQLGLEPPRFCGQCGRRMVVQIRPDGWDARCSRHGAVDSVELEERWAER